MNYGRLIKSRSYSNRRWDLNHCMLRFYFQHSLQPTYYNATIKYCKRLLQSISQADCPRCRSTISTATETFHFSFMHSDKSLEGVLQSHIVLCHTHYDSSLNFFPFSSIPTPSSPVFLLCLY